MMLSPTILLSQSRKYPIVRTEGRDSVVVMTVKQADAINLKFTKMKAELDSIKASISRVETKNDSLTLEVGRCAVYRQMDERLVRDSVNSAYIKIAKGPGFVYLYNGQVYALDMSLFRITMRSTGKIKLKRMTRRQIGKYIEFIKRDSDNSIDWKSEFWDFDLPVLDENKRIEY